MSRSDSLSYKDAGVDIDAGNELVQRIKPAIKSTQRPGVMGSVGGFGGLFELPLDLYPQPLLVSGTDGVGTKLKLAIETGRHDKIGIDLVAMCSNDIAVLGAEPLFFLDYYATGQLSLEVATAVIEGIAEGCRQAGCALIGGETAEMPGMYAEGDYDLAGFCVGIVNKDKVIDGHQVQAGDSLIALPSSGPHSNGYSLIRKVLEHVKADLEMPLTDCTLGQALMAPTQIYNRPLLELAKSVDIHAMAHITGGGLPENLPRVLPASTLARINTKSWQWPEVFKWLQDNGNIETFEMYRTFNCGVGMVLAISAAQESQCLEQLQSQGIAAWKIGHIESSAQDAASVILDGAPGQ